MKTLLLFLFASLSFAQTLPPIHLTNTDKTVNVACTEGVEAYLNVTNGKLTACLSGSIQSLSSAGNTGVADPGANGPMTRTALNVSAPSTAADLAAPAYAIGGGTAQAQTATYSPVVTALTAGTRACWLPAAANTSASPTFAPNGLTAHTIVKAGGALVANDIITTAVACAIYDTVGTQWELQNPQTVPAGSGTSVAQFTYVKTSATVATFGGDCSLSTPCPITNNNVVVLVVTAPFTVTTSATGAGGTGFLYMASSGVMVFGHNSATTMTCSACTVQTGVIAVPSDAIKALWAPTFTNVSGVSTWDAVTPATMDLHGGSLAGNLYAAGLGNGPISTDPITGIKTVPTDPTITPKIAAFTALTDGATVTWPIASGYFANTELTFTTHGGSRTLNITSPLSGGSYVLWLKQDSTGGEGLTLGTGCTWKVINGGAGVVNLSTAANAVDVLAFTYDGTSCFATLGKNYN